MENDVNKSFLFSKKDDSDDKVLGIVNVDGLSLKVKPMHDLYLNWMFEKGRYGKEDVMLKMINIFIKAHRSRYIGTKVDEIKKVVEIQTQYDYYVNLLKTDDKTGTDKNYIGKKNQDIRVKSEDKFHTFVEFQNRASSHLPIARRAVEYFGLALGHHSGKANQMWLLAESVPEVLHGLQTEAYMLRGEVSRELYLDNPWILFVDLRQVYTENEGEVYGDLAGFLLGEVKNSNNRDVQEIINYFNSSFEEFKKEKGVLHMLSKLEILLKDTQIESEAIGEARGKVQGMMQGMAQGIARGETQGIIKFLLKENYSIDEIAKKLEMTEDKVKKIIEDIKKASQST